MKLTVSEVAKQMGVSVRTLHYYDEIGLLNPAGTTAAGYRYYGSAELARLQQILFYRELAFPLKEIAHILSRPDYDSRQALRQHRELLLLQRRHIDSLLRLVDETLGGIEMHPMKTTAESLSAVKKAYAEEARQRWGNTDAYRKSEEKRRGRTAEEESRVSAEADAIFAAFAKAAKAGVSPDTPAAQELAARWQAHITQYEYPCTKEILVCLADMYTGDERFRQMLDRYGKGTADFMAAALHAYCGQ